MAEDVVQRRKRIPVALLIVLALAPYWMLPLAHCCSNPETATGFYNYELPYYMANGRAAFERGNGFAYPNPYDPDPAAPSIYAHWLLWGLGAFTVATQSDPGNVLLGLTFIATLAFGWSSWKLVQQCLPEGESARLPFLLAMWGGGFLVPGGCFAAMMGVKARLPWALQFDPFDGMYFLNWGRNSIFATEAVYHCLAAACWISELRGRRFSGTLWCAALATTHPWSGLQLLLILNVWRFVQFVQQRDRKSAAYLAAAAVMLMMFLAYYKVWLPRFEQHRKLEQVWMLDWSLNTRSAIMAYFPVAILVWLRYRPSQRYTHGGPSAVRSVAAVQDAPDLTASLKSVARFSQPEQFLFCALFVSLGLVFHDRFIRPVQPLHFTRGYVWMPLFLLGLPVLQNCFAKLFNAKRLLVKVGGFALLLLLMVDNLTFFAIYTQKLWNESEGYHITANDRTMFQKIDRQFPGVVVLTDSSVLNYLLPTYANARPWIGHVYNTPDQPQRQRQMDALFAGNDIAAELVPPEVDLIAVRASRDASSLATNPNWDRQEFDNPEWQLWRRSGAN